MTQYCAVLVSREGWCKVTVSFLLLLLQPPPVSCTIKRSIVHDTGGVGGAAEDVEVLSGRTAGGGARTPFDVNKCCFNLQLAKCLLLSAGHCIDCVRYVGGRCFAPPLRRCFRQYR